MPSGGAGLAARTVSSSWLARAIPTYNIAVSYLPLNRVQIGTGYRSLWERERWSRGRATGDVTPLAKVSPQLKVLPVPTRSTPGAGLSPGNGLGGLGFTVVVPFLPEAQTVRCTDAPGVATFVLQKQVNDVGRLDA